MMYFDQAATSFYKPEQVKEAVYRSFDLIGNAGRGAHAPTLNASRLIYDTRVKLAQLFHVEDPARIALTSNATEALNIAIHGLFHPGDHVITTACEHNSVLRPLYVQNKAGVALTIVPADSKGRLDYDAFEQSIRPDTKAIVVTHASNLTGNVTDIARLANIKRRHSILLVVDASQTAGALPIDVQAMDIDVLCFTGHKGLLGPQGTGGLYVRNGISLDHFKVGGSGVHSFDPVHPLDMPEALEAGTMNGHGIAGLNASVSYLLEKGVENIHKREDALARMFAEGLKNVPGVTLYGDLDAPVRTAIVTLNIGDHDSASVSDWLWEDYEICVRSGAHCAPLMHKALGTDEQGAVRFSFSFLNTEEQIAKAIEAVKELAI